MKSKKIIILVLCILTIILIILSIILITNQNDTDTVVEYGKELVDLETDETLNLSGFGVFFEQYTGYLKSSEIASGLETMTITKIPNLYEEVKDYTEEELKAYYDETSSNIKVRYGIEDYEEFSKFINSLKSTGIDLQNWNRLDVLKETFIDESDIENYAYVEYEVTYIGGEKIKFSVYISKTEKTKPTYILRILDS